MKILKLLLILVLAAVTGLYCFSTVSLQLDGSGIGPTLSCETDHLDISVADGESVLLQGITASDKQDGDLTSHILISGISKMVENTARVTYVVFDSDHNMATITRTIGYTDYVSPRFQILEPLNYANNDPIALLDRLKVEDVIDGDITGDVRISYLNSTDQRDVYTIDLQVTNSMGDTARITVPLICRDEPQKGQILLDTYLLYLEQGETFRPRNHISTVTAGYAENPAEAVKITGSVDTGTPGTYYVFYTYTQDGYDLKTALTVVVV